MATMNIDIATTLAAGGIITALATAWVAIGKRRPEISKVIVEGAGAVVIMQRSLLDSQQEQIDAQTARLDALQRQVAQLLVAETDRARELEEERGKVEALTLRVQVLEAALEAADVPIPPEHR